MNKIQKKYYMNFLEIKIYLGFLLSVTWAQFFTGDNLIKIIPAILVVGFTLRRWYIFEKELKNKK